MTGEFKLAPGNFIRGDAVASLVANVQETTRRIDIEVARIVAPSPLIAGGRQLPGPRVDGEDADAVMQPVGGIDEFAVARNHDFHVKFVPTNSSGRVETVC